MPEDFICKVSFSMERGICLLQKRSDSGDVENHSCRMGQHALFKRRQQFHGQTPEAEAFSKGDLPIPTKSYGSEKNATNLRLFPKLCRDHRSLQAK